MQIIDKAVGIDLGTTNSAVGLMNPLDSDVILYRDGAGRETTPSCVWRDPGSGDMVIGHQAFCRRGSSPAPQRSFKRLMGTPAKLELGGGHAMSPEELSAEVLKEMRRQIEVEARRLSTSEATCVVNRAIVTVPAYFDQPQVGATREAARMAGFELLDLLHEPTAAAIYHCWRTKSRDGLFMVYDLGGGTFDVTILKLTAGSPSVLGLSGNTILGGDDLDTAIAEGMLSQLKKEYAMDLNPADPEDELRFELLKFLAEGVKKKLSTEPEYVLRDHSTIRDKAGKQIIFNSVFERGQVEKWMQPVIDRTIPYCHTALEIAQKKAGIKLSDIDEIIFAGGSTHIPAVRERIRKEFCRISEEEWKRFVTEQRAAGNAFPVAPLDNRARCQKPVYEKVDTIVALGAAICAAAIGGVHLTDPEGTVRLELRGLGIAEKSTTDISGNVKPLKGQLPEGCQIALYVPESGYDSKAPLKEKGHFVFESVPFDPTGESTFTFEVLDASENVLAIVVRKLRGGESGPKVVDVGYLPKAISMDVKGASGKERLELVPALTPLPDTKTFDLEHLGNSDCVRFPLYQHRRLIKEVVVPVPSSTPRGTPIHFSIAVDKFSFITIQGKIGEKTFDAAIDPPQPRALPTPAQVAELEASFREGLEYLDTGRRMPKEARFKQGMKAFKGALERNEKDQALHEFEELEDIVDGVARPKINLFPSKSDFDKDVGKLADLINWGRAELKDKKQADDWSEKLEEYRKAGEKAYADGTQRVLNDAVQQLESLRNFVVSELRRQTPPRPEATPAQRAAFFLDQLDEDLTRLENAARSIGNDSALADIQKLRQQLQQASDVAERDPNAALDRLVTINAQTKSIRQQLKVSSDGADGLAGSLGNKHPGNISRENSRL